jgi:hypothetical protein
MNAEFAFFAIGSLLERGVFGVRPGHTPRLKAQTSYSEPPSGANHILLGKTPFFSFKL